MKQTENPTTTAATLSQTVEYTLQVENKEGASILIYGNGPLVVYVCLCLSDLLCISGDWSSGRVLTSREKLILS